MMTKNTTNTLASSTGTSSSSTCDDKKNSMSSSPTPDKTSSDTKRPSTADSAVTTATNNLNSTTEPHENDVLCGRGGSINNHIGNEKYRILVNQKKRVYLTARFKREKRLIAASIVQAIRAKDPPGRFLARDSRTHVWYDIGDVKARDKTSQALREGAPEIRKEMENDRQRQIMRQQQTSQNVSMCDGEGEDDDDIYGDEYLESAMPMIDQAASAFSVPGGPRDEMRLRSHSMTDVDMAPPQDYNGGHGRPHMQFQTLRSSLKKHYTPNNQNTLMPSSTSAWNRTSPATTMSHQQPQQQAQPEQSAAAGHNPRVHFDENERTVHSSRDMTNAGEYNPAFDYPRTTTPPTSSNPNMMRYVKSWDHPYSPGGTPARPPPPKMGYAGEGPMAASPGPGYDSDSTAPLCHTLPSNRAATRSFDERHSGRQAYYGYANEPVTPNTPPPGTGARAYHGLSPLQQRRAQFHRRYQQSMTSSKTTTMKMTSPHVPAPGDNYYPGAAGESDPRRANIFAPPYTTAQDSRPGSLPKQLSSPVNFRPSQNDDMPPPKPVPRHVMNNMMATKRRLNYDSDLQHHHHHQHGNVPNAATGMTPSWEAEMQRLAYGEGNGSGMDPNKRMTPRGGNMDMAMVPVMNEHDQMMQDQLDKQLVESRNEDHDWSARAGCNSLLQVTQDWAPSFIHRASSFEHAEASLCGMELCSFGSIGGPSLCNVFIEDDPVKQQPPPVAVPHHAHTHSTMSGLTNPNFSNANLSNLSKTERLRHQSSWGSGRNSLASGRSLMSPFGSDIGSDTSLMSKSSERGLEPLPIDAPSEPFGPGGYANDAPVDHDFVWSWDGKGTERE